MARGVCPLGGLRSVMTGSGATSGLVLAFSAAPDGPALAARGTSPAHGGCAPGAGGHGRMVP